MISCVLSDAVRELKRYREWTAYESMRDEIDAVIGAMESLRAKLDKAPERETPREE